MIRYFDKVCNHFFWFLIANGESASEWRFDEMPFSISRESALKPLPVTLLFSRMALFGLTSDVGECCRKDDSQNDKENGDASPRAFLGEILLCKMPRRRDVSRFGRSLAPQVIAHGQKGGV